MSEPTLDTLGYTWMRTPQQVPSGSQEKVDINSVAVSADGTRVVTGTFSHTYKNQKGVALLRGSPQAVKEATCNPPAIEPLGVYCYDDQGNLLWSDPFNAQGGVYWVAVSADGAVAAAGGCWKVTCVPGTDGHEHEKTQGFVRAYEVSSGKILLNELTEGRVNQVAFSEDGKYLVSAADSLTMYRRREDDDGTYQGMGVYTPSDNSGVVSVAISDSGMFFVCSTYGGGLSLMENKGGLFARVAKWSVPQKAGQKYPSFCHMLSMAPNGNYFAGGGQDGEFHMFETAKFLQTQEPTYSYSIPGGGGAVYGVAIAPDGSCFAGTTNVKTEGAVYLVKPGVAPDCTLIKKCPTAHNPNCVVINSDIGLMAVADGHPDGQNGSFYLGDLKDDGKGMWSLTTPNMSWPIAISGSGNAVVGGCDYPGNLYYFKIDPPA